MLPTEILDKIFSYLSYSEVYYIRSVNRQWKRLCEYHLYLAFSSPRKKLFVKLSPKSNASLVNMVPHSYDADHQVIEYRLSSDESKACFGANPGRTIQILFDEWFEQATIESGTLDNLSLGERAQILFHLKYNPFREQIFQLPIPKIKQDKQLQYIGDQGMIMTFSYIFSKSDISHLHIHSVHVNLSWLISGINPNIQPQLIYEQRYERLAYILSREYGIFSYSTSAPSVLKYILNYQENLPLDVHQEVVQGYGRNKNNDTQARREQLQLALQSQGVDPRVLWKYTFAKNFILTGNSGIDSHSIARTIYESEKEWAKARYALESQIDH
ncbi:uncharacterized protein B0P05DRAFT_472845 [Gilbertella persicaria]|uniref:uncharacterized protein n=1 Tax=Gilbertella persicaria TaxID=101096 RepID=UPI00221F91F4|nr:uncharacterized protein B0P05DRAFT_472845 [Gilbertella persicaria]KAI8075397.1 hypothetical protein B0P05DRAFT_472845 [Gilbertella persicaria]